MIAHRFRGRNPSIPTFLTETGHRHSNPHVGDDSLPAQSPEPSGQSPPLAAEAATSAMSPAGPASSPIRLVRNAERIAADRQKITESGVLDLLLDHVRGQKELTQSQISTAFGLLKKIIREVQNSIRESVCQLLIDKIAKFDLSASFSVLESKIRGQNGSLIIFKGMQSYNSENIKSLEGYDIAWVEEAQNLSETSLRLLTPTIRKPGSELWFSWNRRHKTDVNWHDNPWFPQVLDKGKDASDEGLKPKGYRHPDAVPFRHVNARLSPSATPAFPCPPAS